MQYVPHLSLYSLVVVMEWKVLLFSPTTATMTYFTVKVHMKI